MWLGNNLLNCLVLGVLASITPWITFDELEVLNEITLFSFFPETGGCNPWL
jgi:hypothetical protein